MNSYFQDNLKLTLKIFVLPINFKYIDMSNNNFINYSFELGMHKTRIPLIGIFCKEIPDPLIFIVDTGSNASLMFPNAYTRLNESIKILEWKNKLMGVDGIQNETTMSEVNFYIGESNFTHQFELFDSTDVVESFSNGSNIEVHGILGTDFLMKHDVTLDYSTFEMKIHNLNSHNQ